MTNKINFPKYSGIRCLMMPYVQGDSKSLPKKYTPYKKILESVFLKKGDIGYLTIDESIAYAGKPHRGKRAKYERPLHTEAGKFYTDYYGWGSTTWGKSKDVILDRDVRLILANSVDNSCAIWHEEHEDTSLDGDIGYAAAQYPYRNAKFMKAGEVANIGILTPHESIPVKEKTNRQFLRIVSSGVHGQEEHFTKNPLMN